MQSLENGLRGNTMVIADKSPAIVIIRTKTFQNQISTFTTRANVIMARYQKCFVIFSDVLTGDQTKSIEITFSDVIGLEDAKEALEDAIILPLKHPEIYAQQNNGKNYLLVPSTLNHYCSLGQWWWPSW